MTQPIRVLIVDDEYSFAEFAKMLVESYGYQAIVATSAVTGLALAAAERPDLILMDVVLPGMDGLEALKKLKSDLTTADIPVILCSISDVGVGPQAMGSGASDFMPKPLKRDDLKVRIDRALAREAK